MANFLSKIKPMLQQSEKNCTVNNGKYLTGEEPNKKINYSHFPLVKFSSNVFVHKLSL
jgi:hypothetical protein